ncbi:DUF4160 domain-containing protein [Candidatus Saganbacteria bacterium]|nr:DUF4160 domain-containing protein [Candidatus Saganbacteria bacterium]
MPKISEFFGISIYIYYREHFPPHFHAIYGGEEALISIENFSLISGKLPPRTMGLVVEWANAHQKELIKAWGQAIAQQPLDKIEPLK